jgi:hypothetical protein
MLLSSLMVNVGILVAPLTGGLSRAVITGYQGHLAGAGLEYLDFITNDGPTRRTNSISACIHVFPYEHAGVGGAGSVMEI